MALEIGSQAPEFNLLDQHGANISLSSFKGCLLYTSPSPRD